MEPKKVLGKGHNTTRVRKKRVYKIRHHCRQYSTSGDRASAAGERPRRRWSAFAAGMQTSHTEYLSICVRGIHFKFENFSTANATISVDVFCSFDVHYERIPIVNN